MGFFVCGRMGRFGDEIENRKIFMKYLTTLLLTLVLFPVFSGAQEPLVVKNLTVIKEKNRFAGWPANHGIWSWGNEIVVGFSFGFHDDEKDEGHPIKGPTSNLQARSLNGGETWAVEELSFLDADENEKGPADCSGGIDFTQPNFAFKFQPGSAIFYYSTDRCKTWVGPFSFPTFGREQVLARTDYIVNGKHDMFVFLTSPKENGKEGWPFCARTRDGGGTWEHIGWIGQQPPVDIYGYAIMPSTVKLKSGAFLSIIRRGGLFDGKARWWLEGFLSPNGGHSWYLLDQPYINNHGNPPHMIRLQDGRIALTYGWREKPYYGIRARISADEGVTWDEEFILRGDGDVWDLGYPRTVQRLDGMCVTIYYFKDNTSKERYIAATIWNPGMREN